MMLSNKFPPAYKKDIELKANQRIQIENQKCNEEMHKVSMSMGRVKPKSDGWVIGFGVIGLIIGFFPCVKSFGTSNSFSGAIFGSIIIWALFVAGGAAIGRAIFSTREQSYESNNLDIETRQRKIQEESNKTIERIKKDSEREYGDYYRQFEEQAQRDSVRYAESELAVKVIKWIGDGFKRTIEGCDRRSHIEKIDVPFVFNVYRNSITCNLGEFDFEIERCKTLENPLEQTALARAISTAIQLDITMTYPTDPSGTDFVLNTNYDYFEDHVMVTMVYLAPNGNYEAVKSW